MYVCMYVCMYVYIFFREREREREHSTSGRVREAAANTLHGLLAERRSITQELPGQSNNLADFTCTARSSSIRIDFEVVEKDTTDTVIPNQ